MPPTYKNSNLNAIIIIIIIIIIIFSIRHTFPKHFVSSQSPLARQDTHRVVTKKPTCQSSIPIEITSSKYKMQTLFPSESLETKWRPASPSRNNISRIFYRTSLDDVAMKGIGLEAI